MNRSHWLVSSALILTGCVQASQSEGQGWDFPAEETNEPSVDVPVDAPKPVEEPQFGNCELEGSSETISYWAEPRVPRFSPNEALFLSPMQYQSTNATVATTGERFSAIQAVELMGADDAWEVGLYGLPYGQAAVRDIASGRELEQFQAVIAGMVVPDGSTAVMTSCGGEDGMELVLYGVDDGSIERVKMSEEVCYGHHYQRQQFLVAAGPDDAYIAGTLGPGEVFVYDRSTGALQSVAVIENAEGEWGAQVASLTVDPSSGELVVIDSRGVLSRRSLPSLAVQSETIGEVGAFSINEYTYAPPYVVSPLAYRADGAVTASTNVEGDIVVRWGDNEQVLPTPPNPMLSEWDERANVPVQIAFSPSGQRIGIAYQFGTAVWRCGNVDAVTSDLTLDIPAEVVREGDRSNVIIPFEVAGNAGIVAVRAELLDGTPLDGNVSSDSITMWLPESDSTIIVRATDGITELMAEVAIRQEN